MILLRNFGFQDHLKGNIWNSQQPLSLNLVQKADDPIQDRIRIIGPLSTFWLKISHTFTLNVTSPECLNDKLPPVDFKNTLLLRYQELKMKIKDQNLFKSAKVYRMQKHRIAPTASQQVKSEILNNQVC